MSYFYGGGGGGGHRFAVEGIKKSLFLLEMIEKF